MFRGITFHSIYYLCVLYWAYIWLVRVDISSELSSASEFVREHGFLTGDLFRADPPIPAIESQSNTSSAAVVDQEQFTNFLEQSSSVAATAVATTNMIGENLTEIGKKKSSKVHEPTKPQNVSGRQPEAMAFNRNALRQGFHRCSDSLTNNSYIVHCTLHEM